jgi:5-methyltetrahydropteroyltriglutamate--homocysteine methyltransferase
VLYEHAIRYEKDASIAENGALVAYSGVKTGRSPKDKRVVLGLVSSKVPSLENKDALKRRIDEASRFVSLDNLCVSPQCGFSSTHHGNNLTEAQEMAKLKLCIDTAKEVWGSL